MNKEVTRTNIINPETLLTQVLHYGKYCKDTPQWGYEVQLGKLIPDDNKLKFNRWFPSDMGFTAKVQKVRDGKDYGPQQDHKCFATQKEATQWAFKTARARIKSTVARDS